jgi:hypothetical protein
MGERLGVLHTNLSSIYIKAKVSGWLAGRVFMYVARRRWAVAMDIFDIYYCCYAAGTFSLGSVLGVTTSSIYMTVAMQRGRFLWGPFWVHYLATTSI